MLATVYVLPYGGIAGNENISVNAPIGAFLSHRAALAGQAMRDELCEEFYGHRLQPGCKARVKLVMEEE